MPVPIRWATWLWETITSGKYLKNKLHSAGIAKIEVERNNAKVHQNQYSLPRPGVVIGQGRRGD